ncbi:MAG: thiol:disulfide interchange protein DsbA/DsbL [Steroidobacteraceae bacterium]
MGRFIPALLGTLAFALPVATPAAPAWTEGVHYERLAPEQHTSVPAGKIEVLEVFSYGCIACNRFQPVLEKLTLSLPPDAQMAFLPASFNASEDWPMFQRSYFAAEALGIAERTHQAMYDAIWKTGELATSDPATHRLKNPQPSLEDAARFYARFAGVKPEEFLSTAKSFSVDLKMKVADQQIAAMSVEITPSIIVNGKYRVRMESMRTAEEVIELVNYLVARERAR